MMLFPADAAAEREGLFVWCPHLIWCTPQSVVQTYAHAAYAAQRGWAYLYGVRGAYLIFDGGPQHMRHHLGEVSEIFSPAVNAKLLYICCLGGSARRDSAEHFSRPWHCFVYGPDPSFR